MRRRTVLGGPTSAYLARPLIARAQQRLPIIGFLNGASAELSVNYVQPFRAGLAEEGYVEGKNVHTLLTSGEQLRRRIQRLEHMPNAVERSEPEEPAERFRQDVGEPVPRNNGRNRFVEGVRDVTGKGRGAESRAAHTRHRKRRDGSSIAVKFLRREEKPKPALAGWRNRHNRALACQPEGEIGVSSGVITPTS